MSTQEEPQSPNPIIDEDDGTDENPARTEALIALLTENPVFGDIAEDVDLAQSCKHYLPISVPWKERLNPVNINSQALHARATTSRETLAVTTKATKLITNAIKIDSRLKGRAPDTYDGDHTKAEKFVVNFELFWMNNEEHSHMKNPYKQCTYFLRLCSGEQIDNWVIHQVKELKKKTTR